MWSLLSTFYSGQQSFIFMSASNWSLGLLLAIPWQTMTGSINLPWWLATIQYSSSIVFVVGLVGWPKVMKIVPILVRGLAVSGFFIASKTSFHLQSREQFLYNIKQLLSLFSLIIQTSMLPYHHTNKPPTPDEDSIIHSFYQERNKRGSYQKYHRLLQRNMPESEQGKENHFPSQKTDNLLNQSANLNQHKEQRSCLLSQPPPSINDSQLLPKNDQRTHCLMRNQPSQEQFQEQLRKKLNKRININQYLNNFEQNRDLEELNENRVEPFTSQKTLKNSHKYQQDDSLFHQSSFGFEQTNKIGSSSRLSQPHHRLSKSVKDSRNSSLRGSSYYELTQNHLTERQPATQTFGSAHSKRSHSSSRRKSQSDQGSREQLNNCLTQEEISQLQENSHPLRSLSTPLHTPTYTLKYQYKDLQPEHPPRPPRPVQRRQPLQSLAQSNSLNNVSSSSKKYESQFPCVSEATKLEQTKSSAQVLKLQAQLQQLKQEHKKQSKLISSVHKMRRVMLNLDEGDQCSLKELWRWIKQLPRK